MDVPFAVTDPNGDALSYVGCEVSYGGLWIDLNDREKFIISGEGTRDQSSKTWRKITAQSPVMGGTYLIHAVPEMVNETISVWVHGISQTDLADNFFFLDELFSQFDFRIRWTFNEYREYWRCQMADAASSRGHVWSHNQMAQTTFTVPRFPEITREVI